MFLNPKNSKCSITSRAKQPFNLFEESGAKIRYFLTIFLISLATLERNILGNVDSSFAEESQYFPLNH